MNVRKRPHGSASGSSTNNSFTPGGPGDSDDSHDNGRRTLRRHAQLVASYLILPLMVISFWIRASSSASKSSFKNIRIEKKKATLAQDVAHDADFSTFETCKVSFKPSPPKRKWRTKPFFVPSYPDAIDETIMRRLFEGITGSPASARSYYAQGATKDGKFRRCQGPFELAACMLVHPIVPLSPLPDDPKFTSLFNEEVILVLRNPRTQLPVHSNMKAIKYHGLTGQQPEDEWRAFRNAWLQSMLEGWRSSILAWTSLKNYKIGLFLPIEDILNPQKGPILLAKLADLLRKHGYEVADKKDMNCIWYQAVGRENIEQFNRYGYEFSDYMPKYTQADQELLLSSLKNISDSHSQYEELVTLMDSYSKDVREKMILE